MTLAVSTVIKSLKDTLMISNLIKALKVKIRSRTRLCFFEFEHLKMSILYLFRLLN